MSVGEELTDHPEREPDDPISIIEMFRAHSQGVYATVDRLLTNPTTADFDHLKLLTGQVADGVDIFGRTGFFRKSESKLTVSAAVSAAVDGLRSVVECIDKVEPGGHSRVVFAVKEGDELLDTPKIVVATGDRPEIVSQWEDADEIDKFADLILETNPEKGDEISKTFVTAVKDAYGYLDAGLMRNPTIQEFMDKKARKKNSAIQLGGVAAAAFAGALLANLFSRMRK